MSSRRSSFLAAVVGPLLIASVGHSVPVPILSIPVTRVGDVAVSSTTGRIYATKGGAQSGVAVIDGALNVVIATITGVGVPAGVAVNSVTNRVYVADWAYARLHVIDGTSNTVVATINGVSACGAHPVAVNDQTNRVYVACGQMTVIDGTTNTVLTTVPLPSWSYGIAVNTTTNRIYSAGWSPGGVAVIDGATNTHVTTLIPGTPYLAAVTVDPVANRLYVSQNGGWNPGHVLVLDAATNALLASVPVGRNPEGIAVNPVTKRVYVDNYSDNTMSVIDGITNTVLATTPVGTGPVDVAVSPLTQLVYVANMYSDTVSVVADIG